MSGEMERSAAHGSTVAALEAWSRGFVAIPIWDDQKRPAVPAWTHTRWESEAQIREEFDRWNRTGASGVGLLLGESSGGLIDVDLDHPKALRLRDHFLPPSRMATGRPGRPRSHRWYLVKDELPQTRQYRLPDRTMLVELRSTGAQTVVPPTMHPSGEQIRWEGKPWGGAEGPAVVDGRKLAVQVALVGIGSVLLTVWPKKGGRHEAYLALAGGLLRYGDQGVHPYWERNLPVLIEAIADATRDEDGSAARVAEVMGTTTSRLREGRQAIGFPRLGELIGNDEAELVRRWARDVEALSGFVGTPIRRMDARAGGPAGEPTTPTEDEEKIESKLPPEERNPLEERISSWAAVDLEPYLSGQVVMPQPDVLCREDGKGLIYPGRVNSLFGLSESGKSWVALHACCQQMDRGERVLYLDFEDSPEGTIGRLRALGSGAEDLLTLFRYVRPEDPISEMQKGKYGERPTEGGRASSSVFQALLDSFDPHLIIVDGMTVLYGLHGQDTNDAGGTDVITGWLKRLCRNGRTTVIAIDHTGKGGGSGSSPIGAHHKIAMVQGSSLRVDVIERPLRGIVGSLRLVVYKDRGSSVREISTKAQEQVAGTVYIDSTQKDVVRIKIEPPDPNEVVLGDSERMNRRLEALARLQELQDNMIDMFGGDLDRALTTREVVAKTGETSSDVRAAWENLLKLGQVNAYGEGRGRHYRLKP